MSAFSKAFPRHMQSLAVPAIRSLNLREDFIPGAFCVNVLDEVVEIPCRVYPNAPNYALSAVPLEQRPLARCLQTRSADGFERQAALGDVLRLNTPWAMPFIVALVGEYVVEILDEIHAGLPMVDPVLLGQFIHLNPEYYALTRARVVSYWNCYYRRRFDRSTYVGFQILKAFDERQESVA